MTTFSVSGTATFSRPAERALLRVAVTSTGDDRATVARQVAEAHAALLAELDALGSSAPERTSSGVVSDTIQEYRGSEPPLSRARTRVSVELVFVDFDLLGTFGGRLAETELVEIEGLSWQLDPATRTSLARSARLEAVRDAATRAADYAAALGTREPALVRLYEEGLRPGSGSGGGAFAKSAFALDASPVGGGATFDLTPPDIEVTVTLSADFTA